MIILCKYYKWRDTIKKLTYHNQKSQPNIFYIKLDVCTWIPYSSQYSWCHPQYRMGREGIQSGFDYKTSMLQDSSHPNNFKTSLFDIFLVFLRFLKKLFLHTWSANQLRCRSWFVPFTSSAHIWTRNFYITEKWIKIN